MVITREADYAIRLMLVLAKRETTTAVSSRVLSEEAHVPYELARGLLAKLADAGLLISYRGRNGGFVLGRNAGDITVGEVFAVAGENLELNVCVADPSSCTSSAYCMMHPVWESASDLLRGYIAPMTLRQVSESGSPHGAGPAC